MKRTTTVILLLCLTLLYISAQKSDGYLPSGITPKRELRAVWLTTIGGLDWPKTYARTPRTIEKQKKELTAILDKLKKANINTVLLQTRVRGTVIYPSSFEPWDGCVSGTTPGMSPGYDPLAFAVDECHKRGMEIQAWMVSIPLGRWNGAGCKNMRSKHPELIMKLNDEGFMRPEKDATARYIAAMCEEIARKYDIDGIHLDYIRYPENMTLKIPREEARRNISNIVRLVSEGVKTIKPWLKVSSSPIGKRTDLSRYSSRGWNAYNKGCQDVELWLRQGWTDQILPMMYFRNDQFFPFAADWKEKSHGRTVAAGLGIYFLSPKEGTWTLADVDRQMQVSRQMGLGQAFFRTKFLLDNVKDIYDYTTERFYQYPALVPEMTWAEHTAPTPPTGLTISRNGDTDVISWGRSSTPGISYNVYASENCQVDIEDARKIIAMRTQSNELAVANCGKKMHYAVTSIDRYGKESKPLQAECGEDKSVSGNPSLMRNDGDLLFLPEKPSTMEASYIIFESATGCVITTKPYTTTVNIKDVPDGMYILRSLSAKGKTHRLGYAFIKRHQI